MLLLIATYGLRRSEVSSLDIDDIQWRARVIRVPRPKVGTPLVVPLTDDVATALVAYLRQRAGEASERRLSLRVRAPWGPIQPTAVFDAFDFWAVRAGVRVPGLGGPHVLRHGLAMHLLRQGTPLKTIGDLLGHRSVESTGVYLRLHVEDLRDLGSPAPKEGFRAGSAVMKEPETFTSPIGPLIARYLAMKRALGRRAVTMAYTFRYIDRFLASYRAADLTRETFTAWSESMTSLQSNTRLARLRAVYHLCLFRQRDIPTVLCQIRHSFHAAALDPCHILFGSRDRPPAHHRGSLGATQGVATAL